MKKLVLAVLVGLTVFATASIAAAEVTVGGAIEMRYDLWDNLDLNDDTEPNSQNFFAQRVLLNVDAKITEGLEAFIELDTENSERAWESTFTYTAVNHQGESLMVKQAWINFMVPGLPVGVKIGHQPLALGHGIWFDTHRGGNDAILLYAKPIEQLLIAGVYFKVVEGSSTDPIVITGSEAHDADVWAALANYTFMPGNTAGVHYTYVRDRASFSPAYLSAHHIGITADGTIGMINYKSEFDYLIAQVNADTNQNPSHNAWAAMLGVGAKLGMANVGIEAAYGTGTNQREASNSRVYGTPYGTTSYDYAFLYNDKIGQGVGFAAIPGYGFGDGTGGFGLANTGYIKVSADVTPMEKLNAGVDVLYLMASSPALPGQARDLGWEIDAHAGYKIYDNLKLDVEGGVFIPGQWYDDIAGLEADTAYGLETKLTVKF
jgi:hypothetical protein